MNLEPSIKFKTLNISHLNEIHNLINDNYRKDPDNIIKTMFSKNFLLWYFKYVPKGLNMGLVYKNILVGVVTVIIVDIMIHTQKKKTAYINFLCINSKLKDTELDNYLVDEIKKRLISLGINHDLIIMEKEPETFFCKCVEFVVPINFTKLKGLGFLKEETRLTESLINPLHFLEIGDLEFVIKELNELNLDVRIIFTFEFAKHFLIPRENIVYSFVNRDHIGKITDFINVYKNYHFCREKNKLISVANLGFYFHKSLNITQLVHYLLERLVLYDFDQLLFRNMYENETINITKYSTKSQFFYSTFEKIDLIKNENIFLFPF